MKQLSFGKPLMFTQLRIESYWMGPFILDKNELVENKNKVKKIVAKATNYQY